jgi:diaminopimelate epimerase
MDKIPFYKMSGSGNDFIIVDNRNGWVDEENLTEVIRKVCSKDMSLGANGFVLVENSKTVDFKWRFFNSDGSPAEMCGNGARCVARFAYLNKITGPDMVFETTAGIVHAQMKGDRVRIQMTDPVFSHAGIVDTDAGRLAFIHLNTGVPHVVIKIEAPSAADVAGLGKTIRFHKMFSPEGANVNFCCIQKDGTLINRTYERGVEGETLACGTGCVASALALAQTTGDLKSPVTVIPKSGEPLLVYYKRDFDRFYEVYLEGNARIICTGQIWQEAWNWK